MDVLEEYAVISPYPHPDKVTLWPVIHVLNQSSEVVDGSCPDLAIMQGVQEFCKITFILKVASLGAEPIPLVSKSKKDLTK